MLTLAEANPHIRTEELRSVSVARSVISSSACEGIEVRASDLFDPRPPYRLRYTAEVTTSLVVGRP